MKPFVIENIEVCRKRAAPAYLGNQIIEIMKKNHHARLRELANDNLEFHWGGVPLFRYVARSKAAREECPKPYFHPLRTLRGDTITNFRPQDHTWHHGLSMTMTLVNGTNFWGGNTYRKGDGYRMRENIGSQNHAGWLEKEVGDTTVRLVQQVGWNSEIGAPYLNERRVIEAKVFPELSCWRLRLSHDFENVSGETLRIGTYESEEGLAGSHYTGLFLRLGRDFLWKGEKDPFGAYLADGTRGVATVHGVSSPWLACVGGHDGTCNLSTVICCDHPDNPNFPVRWFYRVDQPSLGMPFTTSQTLVLKPSEHLFLRHSVIIANGALAPEQAARLIEACA